MGGEIVAAKLLAGEHRRSGPRSPRLFCPRGLHRPSSPGGRSRETERASSNGFPLSPGRERGSGSEGLGGGHAPESSTSKLSPAAASCPSSGVCAPADGCFSSLTLRLGARASPLLDHRLALLLPPLLDLRAGAPRGRSLATTGSDAPASAGRAGGRSSERRRRSSVCGRRWRSGLGWAHHRRAVRLRRGASGFRRRLHAALALRRGPRPRSAALGAAGARSSVCGCPVRSGLPPKTGAGPGDGPRGWRSGGPASGLRPGPPERGAGRAARAPGGLAAVARGLAGRAGSPARGLAPPSAWGAGRRPGRTCGSPAAPRPERRACRAPAPDGPAVARRGGGPVSRGCPAGTACRRGPAACRPPPSGRPRAAARLRLAGDERRHVRQLGRRLRPRRARSGPAGSFQTLGRSGLVSVVMMPRSEARPRRGGRSARRSAARRGGRPSSRRGSRGDSRPGSRSTRCDTKLQRSKRSQPPPAQP